MSSRLFALAVVVASSSVAAAQVQVVPYSTNFNAPTYSDGPLIGQDGWTLTNSTVNPLQVSNTATNGLVTLTTTGQDAQRIFSPAVTATTTSSVYLAATVTVSAAQATGDYALHFTDGSTSNFYARTYFRSSGAGFQMALGTSSGTAVNYGTTVLNFSQSYRVLARYDFVDGAGNDTGALFIDPTSLDGSADTAYVVATTIGTDAASIAGIALRQGAAGNAATLTVDDMAVYYFTPVPEPTTVLLAAAAGLAGVRGLRRSRTRSAVIDQPAAA